MAVNISHELTDKITCAGGSTVLVEPGEKTLAEPALVAAMAPDNADEMAPPPNPPIANPFLTAKQAFDIVFKGI